MPGLFTTLTTAADAMGVYAKALNTVSNNVENAGTAGYARQDFNVVAQPFDPSAGLPGGIAAGEIQNSRDQYAEQAVWTDQQGFGQADQSVTELSAIEPLFNVTGDSGIPQALNAFFGSLSALSVSPNDSVTRNNVLSSATQLAHQFNSVATGLGNASLALNQKITSAADTINGLTQQIAALNGQIGNDARTGTDPAVDASMHNALESLAEYANITVLKQPGGAVTVLMDGQTPLVMGNRQYLISASGATGTAVVKDSLGNNVTAQLLGGRLKALADMKNTVIPGYSSSLNQLASGISDQVNNTLLNGVDTSGNQGAPLFGYNSPADAAATMQVNGITTDQLAAALPGAPGGNGNALALAALANSPEIGSMTFTDAYSSLASQVGQSLNTATQDQTTQQDLLDQARSTRSDTEGVSLDVEATKMIEYQRSYQATAHMVTILNDLTQSVMDMLSAT
jgi:flagellar hook-associated protein 1 FlgK